MINDVYEPNVHSNEETGVAPYGQPMRDVIGGSSLFRILWRGRWLILLSMALAGTGAWFYLQNTTPTYESSSQILVDKPNPQLRSDIPQPVGSTLGNYLATQASMMTSPEIITAALRDPNVIALPSFADPNYAKSLIGTLSAEAGKKTDIIQIRASSPHPEDAARIVNAVARAYIQWHEANHQLSTADLLKDLNSQLERRYSELQGKRKEQMLFEQRHPEVVESARGGIVSKTLDLLKQELATARLAAVERDSYYQGLQRFEKEPEAFRQYVYGHQATAAAAEQDAERIGLQASLEKTRSELQEIQVPGVAQRSRVTMLQSRQDELQGKIAALDTGFVRQHIALAKTLSEDARTREKQLTDMYEKECTKVQSVSELDSQYAFLKSECGMLENLCNSLLNQINQLDLGARLEGLKIYVLAKAVPATAPSSPQAARVIGMGLMLGLMAGVGLAFLRDWRDQRVRSADEVVTILGVPILGAIPSVPRRAIKRGGGKLQFAPNSHASEACRAIRTVLLCSARGEQARTILVTSPGPSEGKTTLVNSLGIAMAQAGQKTLIIDADLRKPMQRRLMSRDGPDKGLADVLTGTTTLDEAIRPTKIQALSILVSGQSPSNPSELLNSRAFAGVLKQLKGQYDRILVDSPPVGMVTDAQILATLCGSTLLVLRAEKSSRILMRRARDALLAVGVRVAGAVVNDVSKRAAKYSYYGGYGHYYSHYGSNGHEATSQELLTDATGCPENGASTPEMKSCGSTTTHVEQRQEGNPPPESGVLPLETKECSPDATGKELLTDPGPRVQNGAVTSEKDQNDRDNDCLMHMVPNAVSNGLPMNGDPSPEETKRNDCKATSDSLPTTGDLRPESGAATSEKKKGRRTKLDYFAAALGPNPQDGASTPEKRKNGRKAASNQVPMNSDPLPEKKENGRRATPGSLPTPGDSHPENGASTAEKNE